MESIVEWAAGRSSYYLGDRVLEIAAKMIPANYPGEVNTNEL